MLKLFDSLTSRLSSVFRAADQAMRAKAVETIAYEVGELENIFALLVMGAFVGLPSPPIHITTDLMPMMEKDLEIMIEKVTTAHDPLGNLFSVLDID